MEFLADYNYSVHHKPERENVADSLSRRPDLQPVDQSSDQLSASVNAVEYALAVNEQVAKTIADAYSRDKELSPIIHRLQRSGRDNMHDLYLWDEHSNHLYLRSSPNNLLCVPNCSVRLQLLQEYHDCATAGHSGRDRTYFRLARYFYWPRMGLDVKKFVKSCGICQRTKANQQRSGLLQSLPIPDAPWKDVSMDFIMGLPLTPRGYDAIYTFVDRLTRSVHLVPTQSSIDAKGSADLYIQNVFRLHGLSSSIVSDRDPRFSAAFFQEIMNRLGTKPCFSTANHPKTDCLTERVNKQVEDILRAFVNHEQDNWDQLLPLCEFSIKSAQRSSVGNSPFYLTYGVHPRSLPDLVFGGESNASVDWLEDRNDALKISRDAVVAAQAHQALYADRGREPSNLQVGDPVLVYQDFLLSPEARQQPSRKLHQKWFGPYRILAKKICNAFRLELPNGHRCHPAFNVTDLSGMKRMPFHVLIIVAKFTELCVLG